MIINIYTLAFFIMVIIAVYFIIVAATHNNKLIFVLGIFSILGIIMAIVLISLLNGWYFL